MDIIKTDNTKYEEYEALLLERDQAEKEAGSIWTAYTKEFGPLLTAVFEETIECIKRKKMISCYQDAINHGRNIDQNELQAWIDREMAEYNSRLQTMLKNNERCQKSKTSSAYKTKRCRELYRRIARKIHPDTHPGTDQNEILSDLWEQTVRAYHANDLKRISELEVLVNKAVRDMGKLPERIEIPDIEKRIDELKEEIMVIKTTEPYTHMYLLEDPDAVAGKKKELEEQLASYTKYKDELDLVISDLLSKGGFTIQWQMN